jgi:hypothetical protein
MTNFRRWRRLPWAPAFWSGYVALWMLVTDSGLTLASMWWLAGMAGLSLLRPTYRTARNGSPSPAPESPGDLVPSPSGPVPGTAAHTPERRTSSHEQ